MINITLHNCHLSVSALAELHVGAAPLKTSGVRHELRGAHRLHLPEELHGAARHVPALLQTLSVETILDTHYQWSADIVSTSDPGFHFCRA